MQGEPLLFKYFLGSGSGFGVKFRAAYADMTFMRISSGFAEIGLAVPGSQRIASEQFYVWPLYNAGRVENIRSVTRRTESNVTYMKPSPEDRDRIINLSKERSMKEYSATGKLHNRQYEIQSGSLFDAIV